MKKKYALLVTAFFTLVILGTIPTVAGTTDQWFPRGGISTVFPVSHKVVLQNGSTYTTSQFDLYTFGGKYVAIPTINKHLFNQTYYPPTSIANGTEIVYFYNYSQGDGNQWNRTPSFSWGPGNVVTGIEIELYLITWTSGGQYRPMQPDNDTVAKSGFFTTLAPMAILDYFNCSKGVGETIPPLSHVITEVTSDTITAELEDTWANTTYIARRDGKVLMYSLESFGPIVTNAGAETITLIFGSYNPSGIPTFPVLLTAFSLLLAVLLVEIGRRRKISL